LPFYLLKPEVVTHLHYEFEGWLGDDLLTTFPEFIVTERLAAALEASKPTGLRLAGVEPPPVACGNSSMTNGPFPSAAGSRYQDRQAREISGAPSWPTSWSHSRQLAAGAFR
jgi:hypothetical protein